MKRGRKITLIVLLAVVAVIGTIGGVTLAQSDDEGTTTTAETERFAYLERMAEIYQEKTGVALDVDALKESFCQAGEEMREQIRNQFRQRLIDEGVFTEEELTELEDWWAARPDVTSEFPRFQQRPFQRLPRFGGGFGEGFGGWCFGDDSGE
ncbi:MAG: hypothetical protein PVG61_08135 [Dehalococcoidia bacterium]|jgi:type II secretory pathway pseudopilin PulG